MTGAGDWHEAVLVITNPLGLHARPAARFVQIASQFSCEIVVDNLTSGAGPARARSMTDVTTLGAYQGHQIKVRARGDDAESALAALTELAVRGFDDTSESSAPVGTAHPQVFEVAAGDRPVMQGMPTSPGVAVGRARRIRRGPPRPRAQGTPAAELAALQAALDRAHDDVRALRDTLARQAGEEHAAMLDAQIAILRDDALLEPAKADIAAGAKAEQAWEAAVTAAAARFAALDDGYLRARADDVREIGRRILDHLMGQGASVELRGPGIVIARELGPAQTAALDLDLVKGIVVATGSPTSHAAILARALGVPAVVNAGDLVLTISEETMLLVDGDTGSVVIDPDPVQLAAVRDRSVPLSMSAAEPASTEGLLPIGVAANVASLAEVIRAREHGATAVGLFRTEFLYMNRDVAPEEDEQTTVYRQAAEAVSGHLVVRTADVGADKPIPGMPPDPGENPALGRRAIRLHGAWPELLETQLRAVLRAAADRPNIAVLFPMVTTVDEVHALRSALETARNELEAEGRPGGTPAVGVMVEVPAAALLADHLVELVDFVSIGTNDLTQYAMAAERGNPAVDRLADSAHPAVLRLIAMVCDAAGERGVPVGVCGEAAADPSLIPIFAGLGVTELSVAPPALARVREVVAALDVAAAGRLAEHALGCGSAAAVRALTTSSG